MKVFETGEVLKYLKSRNLEKQYKKSKKYILSNQGEKTKLKIRKPKTEKIYQFRINKKYRAFGIIDSEKDLIVFEISDHQ